MESGNILNATDIMIILGLIGLSIYWMLNSLKAKKDKGSDIDDYYNEVLNDKKYKVKGKFES